MQKRTLLVIAGIPIAIFLIAASYYVAFYLPKKQSANIELARLELEVRLEKEKTEQIKIEQEKADAEAEKQKLENEKQQQIDAAAAQEAANKSQQQKAASAALSKCLAAADANYKARASRVELDASNADSTLDFLNTNRIQARNECYK